MSNLNFFYTDKPTGKFIALFSDGSGGDIFMEVGKKDGSRNMSIVMEN